MYSEFWGSQLTPQTFLAWAHLLFSAEDGLERMHGCNQSNSTLPLTCFLI